MLKYGNKELRNIQEQVLKNAYDIQAMNEINDIGIKVVGRVDSVTELPDPAEYEGEYGDTFAVGNEPPYNFYVFTRPFSEEIGPTWFCIGIVQLQGEKGDKGDQGEQGPQGEATEWTSGNYNTVIAPNPASYGNVGDYFLDTSNTGNRGYIFKKVSETAWGNTYFNIVGPQGPQGLPGPQGIQGIQGVQGPKGDTGDVGGFINIRAVIASTDLLPDPEALNDPTAAYLVGDNKDLYIQVGETKETRVWSNVGMLNVATYVTKDGIFQNVWEADSKADVSELEIVDEKVTELQNIMQNVTRDEVSETIKVSDKLEIEQDLRVNGDAYIFEQIADSQGRFRFFEGSITSSGVGDRPNITYGKWSLSGSHLMFVMGGKFEADHTYQDFTTHYTSGITLPSWILNKIYPLFEGAGHVNPIVTIGDCVISTLTGPAETTKINVCLWKSTDGDYGISTLGSYIPTEETAFRLQIDLLIDNN